MNERRQCLRWATGLFGMGASARVAALGLEPLVWRQRMLVGFGTTLWIKAAHPNADQLEGALDEAVMLIRHIERQMSLFDPHSALARLNRSGQISTPHDDLVSVLRTSRQISQASKGSFDVSVQPLWTLWKQASEHGTQPSASAIRRVQQSIDWRAIELSPGRVRLHRPGMQLSLNGIAQGYASDRVKALLGERGIRHALIDTGETSLLGRGPDNRPWTFDIEDVASPSHRSPPTVTSDGRAIATSSDAHTAFSADHRDHHIMDPRTGHSPPYWSSVTVLAPSCTVADALTKVFFMLAPDQLESVARRWSVDVIAQDKSGHWVSTLARRVDDTRAVLE